MPMALLVFDTEGDQELDIMDLVKLPALLIQGISLDKVKEMIVKEGIDEYKYYSIKKMLERKGYNVIRIPRGSADLLSYMGTL